MLVSVLCHCAAGGQGVGADIIHGVMALLCWAPRWRGLAGHERLAARRLVPGQALAPALLPPAVRCARGGGSPTVFR